MKAKQRQTETRFDRFPSSFSDERGVHRQVSNSELRQGATDGQEAELVCNEIKLQMLTLEKLRWIKKV